MLIYKCRDMGTYMMVSMHIVHRGIYVRVYVYVYIMCIIRNIHIYIYTHTYMYVSVYMMSVQVTRETNSIESAWLHDDSQGA